MPLFEVWIKNRKLRMNEPKYVFAKDENEAMIPFKDKAIQAKLLAQNNEVLFIIPKDTINFA